MMQGEGEKEGEDNGGQRRLGRREGEGMKGMEKREKERNGREQREEEERQRGKGVGGGGEEEEERGGCDTYHSASFS